MGMATQPSWQQRHAASPVPESGVPTTPSAPKASVLSVFGLCGGDFVLLVSPDVLTPNKEAQRATPALPGVAVPSPAGCVQLAEAPRTGGRGEPCVATPCFGCCAIPEVNLCGKQGKEPTKAPRRGWWLWDGMAKAGQPRLCCCCLPGLLPVAMVMDDSLPSVEALCKATPALCKAVCCLWLLLLLLLVTPVQG